MTRTDRVGLHRRLAEGLVDGFRNALERQAILLPDEWTLSEDMVFWSPTLGKGVDFPYGKTLAEAGMSFAQIASLEQQWYWSKLPNFRAVESGPIRVDEAGWAQWWTMEGTDVRGRVYRLHEVDFMTTDDSGAINRWEAFLDWSEFGPIIELMSGRTFQDGITVEEYMGLAGEFLAQQPPSK